MFKVHQIVNYNYSFDARLGGPGRLQLWGAQAKVAEIIFVPDGVPLPPPVLWPNLTGANAAFRFGAAEGLIDMLRNEGPISITVNDQPPGFVFIHTGLEPVSEEERKNV
ncbi:MAG TPA: hypothetical protein VI356_15730 [Myxococcales bacterium]